jgi:CDP-diacylglycerol--glycerol-3-phosphate 3-phosphatidyltransferase/cardiolipin synthase
VKAEGIPASGEQQVGSGKVLTPANVVSFSRVPLAVVFAWLPGVGLRLVVLAVAAGTDLLDGWLARRLGPSRLGAWMDPVTDKIFMLTAFAVLAVSGALGPFEVVGVLLRDVVAPVGYLTSVVARRPLNVPPARVGGKAVTVGQTLTLFAWLFDSPLLKPLAWATAAMALYAIADYGRLAVRRGERPHS